MARLQNCSEITKWNSIFGHGLFCLVALLSACLVVFLSFPFLSFCLFVLTSLWSDVGMFSSLKSHSVSSKVEVSHWPRRVGIELAVQLKMIKSERKQIGDNPILSAPHCPAKGRGTRDSGNHIFKHNFVQFFLHFQISDLSLNHWPRGWEGSRRSKTQATYWPKGKHCPRFNICFSNLSSFFTPALLQPLQCKSL